MVVNNQALSRNYNQLVELKCVLEKDEMFFKQVWTVFLDHLPSLSALVWSGGNYSGGGTAPLSRRGPGKHKTTLCYGRHPEEKLLPLREDSL